MSLALLIDITASALAGGVIGWTTNALAINMLFKKYGKWGGVIEASYHEFIRDMSALIENNLLNHETLRERLKAEPLRNEMRHWISDTLSRTLPEHSGTVRLIDLPGAAQSAAGLINLAEKKERLFFHRVLKSIERQSAADYLSPEQFRHISSAVCHVISSRQEPFKALFQTWHTETESAATLGEALPEGLADQLQANLHNALAQTDKARFDAAIDHICARLFRAFDAAALGHLPLGEFLGEAAPLVRKAAQLIEAPETKPLLLELISCILEEAKRSEVPLASLVTEELRTELATFCKRKIPEALEALITILMEHRAEIEALVNRAIDEQLDTTIGGMTGKLLKNLVTNNLARESDLCGKLAAALREQSGAAAEAINKALAQKLENTTLGALITQLSGFLDAEYLFKSLRALLRDASENPDRYALYVEGLLKRSLYEICAASGFSQDISGLFPWIMDTIKQRFLYEGKAQAALLSYLEAHPVRDAPNPLAVFFKKTATAHWDARIMARTLYGLWDILAKMPAGALCKPVYAAAPHGYLTHILGRQLWRKYRTTELRKIYGLLQHEQVYTKAEEALNTLIDEHLDTMLTGTVSALAAGELRKLCPQDINRIVQRFIGSEMKSINILGGVLGALTGILTAAASLVAGLSAPLTWWLYMMIFAGLGIGTNALAIRMLFRPYKPLYPGASVPPFIGVAPARKVEFARLAGAVIQTTMFGSKPLAEFFTQQKEAIRAYCFEKIGASDYAALDALLAEDSRHKALAGMVTEAISTYLAEHKDACAAALEEGIAQFVRRGSIRRHIPVFCRMFRTMLGRKIPALASVIKKGLFAFKAPLTRAAGRYVARQALESLQTLLTTNALKDFAHRHNEAFSLYLKTHSLEQLGGEHLAETVSRNMPHLAAAGLHGLVAPALDALERAVYNKKKLREYAGGSIFHYVQKNMGLFLNLFLTQSMTYPVRARLARTIERALPLYALPWKDHVRPVLDTLLDRDAPRFITAHAADFSPVSEALGEATAAELCGGKPFLNRLPAQAALFAVTDAQAVQARITRAAAAGAARLLSMPLETMLGAFRVHDAGTFVAALERPLQAVMAHLHGRIASGAAAEVLAPRVETLLRQWFSTGATDQLLYHIDIDAAVHSCTALYVTNAANLRGLEAGLELLLDGLVQHPALWNRRVLRRDMARLLGDRERVCSALKPVFEETLSTMNAAVATDTKDALWGGQILPAVLDAGERHLAPLIDAVDVQGVIEGEINTMDGEGIERLFRGFAGRYFTKIIWYGWIGAFGGLIGYLVSRFAGR